MNHVQRTPCEAANSGGPRVNCTQAVGDLPVTRGRRRAQYLAMDKEDDSPSNPSDLADQPAAGEDACPVREITLAQEIIDNLPYAVMVLLGSAILLIGLGAWRWAAGGAYFAYGLVGVLWIIVFLCPHCHFFDTRLCPCGYGRIAAKLRSRQDGDRFAEKFRRHIPVIVPLWLIPPAAGVIVLVRQFSAAVLVLVVAFAINSFLILPLVSRKYGCARCPQKESCPWMGRGAR